ncbi:kinesin-like protein KIN-4C [Quercus robur]|uniref:kinesin-like protein KIN-4C n=1 Tax=Quercus robur TaxID=38942 RepID=UPI0021617AA9|nr:kinesin-like protein KIN-4C [Quercus robur]
MSTKSCIDCREKDSEIRDLKEKVVKLEMEKADCREKDSEIRDLKEKVATLSKYASKLEMEKAKLIHQKESLGYRSSSRLEDMDTSESEYLDDSDDDDWSQKKKKKKKKKKNLLRKGFVEQV